MDIVALARSYPSIYGRPIIERVEARLFRRRYFRHCMACGFCGDSCCRYGVDVDPENAARILAHADGLSAWIALPPERWFGEERDDLEYPTGRVLRTTVVDGACVFLRRDGRGCQLHRFALERGLDYHLLKPMISAIFPATFYEATLGVAAEVDDGSLVCLDRGDTVYRSVRSELTYYFGAALVEELDEIERAAIDQPDKAAVTAAITLTQSPASG